MFIIQTRKQSAKRNTEEFFDNNANPENWNNYSSTAYDTIEEAIRECKATITYGCYKAFDVRIVEVVCNFESKVMVSAQSKKYPEVQG